MTESRRSIFTRLAWAAGALSLLLVLALWWITHQTVRATLAESAQKEIDIDVAGLVDIYASNGREELARRISDRIALTPTEGNTPHYLLANDAGQRIAGDLGSWPALDPKVSESGVIAIGEGSAGFARAVQIDENLRLVVARRQADDGPLLQRIAIAFVFGGAVLIALVLLLGRVAALRLGRRIERINAAFRDPGATHALVQADPVRADEIDELAAHSAAALERVRDLLEAYRDTSDQLAHEIRTPLGHLDARLVKALREHPQEPVAARLLEARAEIRRLVQTLESLLDIASSKARRGDKAGLKRFDFSAMVTRICELYSGSAEETGHAFAWEIEPGVLLEGEQEQLSRLVTNLLDNAFKYVPGGGRIEVKLGAGPLLTISDDGPGIPKAEHARIFERFYRGRAAHGELPGSGLGLALASAIADRHGLRLGIDDTQRGATFRLERA